MTAFHGKHGAVSFDSAYVLNVVNWSLKADCRTVEVTSMIGDVSAWSDAAVSYAAGDIVSYSNAVYQCHVAHTSAVGKEPTETAWWTPVVGNVERLAGFKDWRITTECIYDTVGLDPNIGADLKTSSGADIVLSYATPGGAGKCITANGIIESVGFGQTKDGTPTIIYTFAPSTAAGRALVEGDE